jgi:hypothetical protein
MLREQGAHRSEVDVGEGEDGHAGSCREAWRAARNYAGREIERRCRDADARTGSGRPWGFRLRGLA